MNAGLAIGLAVGGGVAGGIGMNWVINQNRQSREDHVALIDRETTAARQTWDEWNGRMLQEFPGGRLNTPEDHARFEKFLQSNPVPPWLNVKHDDFTRVRTSVDEYPMRGAPTILSKPISMANQEYEPAGVVFGPLSLAMGLGIAYMGARSIKNPVGAIAALVGGGAIAALGVGAAIDSVNQLREPNSDKTMRGYYDLVSEINKNS